MYHYGETTLLLLCPFLLCSAQDPNCAYKECECDDTEISCDSEGLFSIPKNISEVNVIYKMFDLTDNSISTVPGGIFPPNLKSISFLNNPITTIDDAAFEGSENTLESLSFSQARFTRIPNAFLRLKALSALEIYQTNIIDWNVEAMKVIGLTVEILNLDTVGLSVWPEWIQDFHKVTNLAISSSSIKSIPDNAFDQLANTLVDLALVTSKFEAVPKAISNLSTLKSLTLTENKISDLTWLPKRSKLSSLSLNNNSLSDHVQLSDALRPYADTLTDLSLEINKLTAVPELGFLTQINTFDFSDNRLSDPVSGSLPAATLNIQLNANYLPAIPQALSQLQFVTDVELNYNAITEIRGSDIPPSVERAEFQHNIIKELTDASFPVNSSMTYVHLEYNPITRISISAFENLSHLRELYLGGTKLVRLPLALTALKNLDLFDISDSTSIVCTCEEKNLEKWVTSLTKDNVWGDCGVVSVYEFYSTLSPDCPDL